jgi:hypothetical protein
MKAVNPRRLADLRVVHFSGNQDCLPIHDKKYGYVSTALGRCGLMNLPRQYSYNPRWSLVFLLFGGVLAWLVVVGLACGCRPHGFVLWFALALSILGLLSTVRRLAFKCYLVLDKDALLLPTGFGRVRTKRVPYASIERIWETRLPFTVVLSVGTKEGKFEVVSAMLPDAGSYIEVGRFLYAQVNRPNF